MSGINKVILIGRLGQDPEIRYTADGKACASLSIATSESWKDKTTGEKKEKTEWHRVSAFGRTAEVMGQYLNKGSNVYIEGKLQTRKWQDKDGNDKYTTEIICSNMQMLDGRSSGQSDPAGGAAQSQPDPAGGDFDDDIPFARHHGLV